MLKESYDWHMTCQCLHVLILSRYFVEAGMSQSRFLNILVHSLSFPPIFVIFYFVRMFNCSIFICFLLFLVLKQWRMKMKYVMFMWKLKYNCIYHDLYVWCFIDLVSCLILLCWIHLLLVDISFLVPCWVRKEHFPWNLYFYVLL